MSWKIYQDKEYYGEENIIFSSLVLLTYNGEYERDDIHYTNENIENIIKNEIDVKIKESNQNNRLWINILNETKNNKDLYFSIAHKLEGKGLEIEPKNPERDKNISDKLSGYYAELETHYDNIKKNINLEHKKMMKEDVLIRHIIIPVFFEANKNEPVLLINILKIDEKESNFDPMCFLLKTLYLHKKDYEKYYRSLIVYSAIKSALSAIMSRNMSHNLGSHVLVNVDRVMPYTPIPEHQKLIRYLHERMDFLAQITTLWLPEWSQSNYITKEIMRYFSKQNHLLHHIARADGLEYSNNEDYYINYDNSLDKSKIQTFSHCVKAISEGNEKEILYTFAFGKESDECQKNKIPQDFLVDIPGGKVGFHALYTIFENVLRNAAKYGFSTQPKAFRENKSMTINVKIIDKKETEDDYVLQIADSISYVSHIYNDQEDRNEAIMKIQSFINEEGKDSIESVKMEEEVGKFFRITICLNGISTGETKELNLYIHKFDDNYKMVSIDRLDKLIKEPGYYFINQNTLETVLDSLEGDKEEDNVFEYLKNKIEDKNFYFDFLKKLYEKEVFDPLHERMNDKICLPIVDETGGVEFRHMGISEIKICAAYLAGEKDLMQFGEKQERKYIKAIPFPIYDRNNRLLCYRLGYELKLKKPTKYLVTQSFFDSDNPEFVLLEEHL